MRLRHAVVAARIFRHETMPVSFQDIVLAFEFVSSGDVGGNTAVLCRSSGKIYWRSDFSDLDQMDELPDDAEDDEQYLAIPDKGELDLGKPLALDFASEHLPDELDEVRSIFSRSGAYRNFRALLIRTKALERWYAFERERTEHALRDWCEENGIELEG